MKRLTLVMVLLATTPALADVVLVDVPVQLKKPKHWMARLGRNAVLWQLRSCIGETGYRQDLCTAMTYVHGRRARKRGISHATMTRAYSSAVKPRHARPWVMQLELKPRRPKAYRFRRWLPKEHAKMVAHVRAVLRGEVPDPCEAEKPTHYGALRLDGKPRGGKWRRAQCLLGQPNMRREQAFWVRSK